MDELQQIMKLCLRYLEPKDMCMLQCICSDLRDMPLSLQDHSIDFQLDGSASATTWLQKNIVSMQKLALETDHDLPPELLQDVMEGGR